jgi:hypothetical protein
MADLSDVETSMLASVTTSVYPTGIGAPSAIGPICRIYRGWPTSGSLNADLAAGKVNITISPDSHMGRTTTRYAPVWSSTPQTPDLSAVVTGCCISFSGSGGGNVAIGIRVDDKSYTYRPLATDNATLIAAILAAQIQNDQMVLLLGSTITIPGATTIVARVVPDSLSVQEVRRQERQIRVICWCPSPILRDVASSVVDTGLAASPFIPLSDGSQARVSYEGTLVFDQSQNALLYRRDLLYNAEYPTMITATTPSMLFGNLIINADSQTV